MKRNDFTTNEGLPSNHIYDIVEDNKGFLWIATDNGVSRFDGKYFQNFSVKQGLPSNEVLQILRDGTGNIWANSYKQLPAYFDEVTGRFVTIKNHENLQLITQSLLFATHLSDGAIKFYNPAGYVTVKNKQVIAYGSLLQDRLLIDGTPVDISFKVKTGNVYCNYFYLNNQLIDSIVLRLESNFIKTYFNDNCIFYFTNKGKIYKVSKIKIQPLSYQSDQLQIPEHIAWSKFSDQNLIVTSTKGNVFVYNKNDLSPVARLVGNIKANCAYMDKFGNIWIGTLDEGVVYYGNNKIRNINIPPNYVKPNFLSIAISERNELFAGNYYGQVLKIEKDKLRKFEYRHADYQTWIRRLICMNDKIVTVNDRGYSINFKPDIPLSTPKQKATSLKDAVAINDSIIVFGTIAGLKELNINTGQTRDLNSNNERSLSLVHTGSNLIYYIGTKGLYQYHIEKNRSAFIALNNTFKNERLSALTYAADGSLWASSLDGNLLIFKSDTIFADIRQNAALPDNITCLLAHRDKIWIGGKNGIAILTYSFSGRKLNYKIHTISKNDGLPSNSINDLVAKDDTVYVATENGIAAIPANYQHQKFEIIPELTGVKVNQAAIPIAKQYRLESDQNNVTLQFSGIELSGHFKAIQYSINDGETWGTLDGNTLNIQLNSGSHTIFIRAVDANNQISERILKLDFYIKTPFYKSIWFWILIAIAITAAFFWWIYWIRLQKQKNIYEQQLALELQRKKITADLHDDIGATLSSLQLNSAVANQLMDVDQSRARSMLHKIEDQSQSLADKIGDIIWSMKPGKDELMTISSRIKNFAHDILSACEGMNYKVLIDADANISIQNITMRKNIVLITKEAINNVAKYSNATEVFIGLEIKDKWISLTVRDNGKGFDIAAQKGNGIANMRIRAEELSGIFTIDTALNKGTLVSVQIPLIP